MKTYTIFARSLNNPAQMRKITEVSCNNWGEARQWAMVNCWKDVRGDEKMIVEPTLVEWIDQLCSEE